MAWGTMQVGALLLKETDILEDVTNANTGERTVRWEGRETAPSAATQADIAAKQADIMGLIDRVFAVQFQRKTEYNGFYRFTDTNTQLEKWGEGPAQVRWSLAAQYLGPDNALDLESRLANVVRANDFSLTGERWHAPASGHLMYHVGPVAPASLVRTTAFGESITVYRSIPAGVNPRWGATVAGYQGGRVRFLLNGVERVSPRLPMATTGWELNNGLLRIKPYVGASNSTLFIAFWNGTAWVERPWDVRIAGDSIVPDTHWQQVVVTRLDPEVVQLRIYIRQPSNGQRAILDLVLRRGSRFVEGYVQRQTSGDLSIAPDVGDTNPNWTSGTGYVIGPPDADDNYWITGSARSFTTFASGGFSKTGVTALDFWIGVVVPKASVGGSNPGFETGTSSQWSGAGLTVEVRSDTPKYGTYYGRVTATAAATALRMEHTPTGSVGTPGKSYTIAGWIRSPVAVSAGQSQLLLHWYNGGAYLNSTTFMGPALAANVWTPVIGTGTALAGTTLIGREARLNSGVVSVGTILDVDSLQVREATPSGDVATDFVQQYIGAMAEKVGVARR